MFNLRPNDLNFYLRGLQLSDHAPTAVERRFISWNVLKKTYAFPEKSLQDGSVPVFPCGTNGLNLNETDEMYMQRLGYIAQCISKSLQNTQNGIFLLQEMPSFSDKKIEDLFMSHIKGACIVHDGASLAIIYNSSKYTYESTEMPRTAYGTAFFPQVQIVKLKENETGNKFAIVNVHCKHPTLSGNLGEGLTDILKKSLKPIVTKLLSEGYHVICGGDTNSARIVDTIGKSPDESRHIFAEKFCETLGLAPASCSHSSISAPSYEARIGGFRAMDIIFHANPPTSNMPYDPGITTSEQMEKLFNPGFLEQLSSLIASQEQYIYSPEEFRKGLQILDMFGSHGKNGNLFDTSRGGQRLSKESVAKYLANDQISFSNLCCQIKDTHAFLAVLKKAHVLRYEATDMECIALIFKKLKDDPVLRQRAKNELATDQEHQQFDQLLTNVFPTFPGKERQTAPPDQSFISYLSRPCWDTEYTVARKILTQKGPLTSWHPEQLNSLVVPACLTRNSPVTSGDVLFIDLDLKEKFITNYMITQCAGF